LHRVFSFLFCKDGSCMYMFLIKIICSFSGGNTSELLNGKRYKSSSYFSKTVISLVQEEQFDPYHLRIIFTRSCSLCSSKQYWVLSARTSARSDKTCWTKSFSCQTYLIEIAKILPILREHILWFESVGNPIFDRIQSK